MSNAAMKRIAPSAKQPERKRAIRFTRRGDQPVTILVGNFLYERDQDPAVGPFILTFLDKPDRNDPNNEPFMVVSGVLAFEVDPAPEPEFEEVP